MSRVANPGQVPVGYWIDLTELAQRYGWERLPSWINWRTFYPSIRFNQFVMTGGLDWNQAMAETVPAAKRWKLPRRYLQIRPPLPQPSAYTPRFTPKPVTPRQPPP